MASLVNEIRASNHLTLLVNRDPKKGSKPKPPEPFPTPDDNKPKAPPPNSFAAMVIRAKKAARLKKERMHG